MNVHRVPIILAAARNKVPTTYWLSAFARDGGLLSYGVNAADTWRLVANYVDRILRAPRRAISRYPVKYEMALNLKAAKALGLTVPLPVLALADEVME
jgi:putative tryptophan/tyrosine transport system substrate-binding protein